MILARLDHLSKHEQQEVTVRAWIYNVRSSGRIVFLQLRDGYGFAQAIVSQDEVKAAVWERVCALTLESSIVVQGIVKKHPRQNIYELDVRDIQEFQTAAEYPISKKEHGIDFLMDNRHLWLRSQRQWAVQRVRNTVIKAIYDFMDAEGFLKIDSPILTPSACEGTTELFEIEYFGQKAYLSQSGQLYLEAAIFAHNRVFDFGPVFRAEKSKTRRHLTEFWMMDAEMAFCDHDKNIQIQEQLVSYLVDKTLKKNTQEFEILERDTGKLSKIKPPFERMTYHEAIKKLQSFGSDIKEGEDLGGDDETLLTFHYDKPIVVEKYPGELKAFYMKRDSQNEKLALCNDMLAPEGYGEIIGGSEREDSYDTLAKRLREFKLPAKEYKWYLDLRKYGSVPHSGFGLGLERMVLWICGLKHVRETIPFPRTITRLRP